MAKREVERTVQQSLLDRLIDHDPTSSTERPRTWAQSVSEFKQAVRRDVEWLLNTRRIADPAPEGFGEVQHSLYHYGLPDITSLSADSPETRQHLTRRIEEAVSEHEPRLESVRVGVVDTGEGAKRQLHFTIEGLLKMEPNPEQVVFDTMLEVTSGKFEIK
jgi:type VI secretion system protein ImpF